MELIKKISNSKGYLLAFTLLALTCTFVQFNIPFLHRDWILLFFSSLILLFCGVTPNQMRGFSFFFVYVCVLLLNYVTGDNYYSSFAIVICEVAMLYVSVSFYDLAKVCNFKIQRLLLVTFVCGLVVTAVGTYLAEQLVPGILRMVQTEILNNNEAATLYAFHKMGMTNYALPHALPAILPIYILIIKEKNLSILIKLVNLIALVSSLCIVFYSGATTPVLLSFISLGVAIFTKVDKISKNIVRMLVLSFVILLLVFSKEYLAQFFQYVSEKIYLVGGNYSLVERFSELSEFIQTGNTGDDLEGRMDHYNSTTSVINTNIFWGVNENSYGGHSAFLDKIATLGLVGIVPLIVFLASQSIAVFCRLLPKYRITYMECMCIAFMIILTKNMFSREFCLITFLIIPLSLSFLQKNQK